MKRNTVKMFVLALALAGSIPAFAQSEQQRQIIKKDNNSAELLRLKEEFAVTSKADRENAYRLAAEKGWPITFTTEEGNFAELMGVHPNGNPSYYVTFNQGAAFTSGITALNSDGSLGLNLNGQGMIIGVWDSNHPRATHNTFGGRCQVQDASVSQSMHSTHVLGTMMGSGVGSVNTNAKGMAYEANGHAYNWTDDAPEMAAEADAGLLVSNHSYGSFAGQLTEAMFGAYGSKAAQYDQVAFNAKNYLIVQAAGNDRDDNNQQFNPNKGGYDLINGSKTAKNAITVAAVYGMSSAYSSPSDVVMSPFSSYGPTDDNRIKPDISAKGMNVYSSINDTNSSYGNSSGTSMASPVVAGGALLLQQHYFNLNAAYMRSATLRGLICHTANEAGFWDGPDGMFGWGLFDAKKAAQAITNNGTTALISQLSLSQGQTYTKQVTAAGGQPVQVSICWTDPAGTTNSTVIDLATPVLVNDLDVRVTKGAETFLPWKLGATPTSNAVRSDNNVDNIERVDIANASGNYTITVTHKSNLTFGPQQYSLIVTGITNASAGVNENDRSIFTMWPNPASSVLNINMEMALENDASFAIYDVQGRQVLAGALSESNSAVNVAGLTSGMYIVTVDSGTKQQSKKVIITK